MKTSIRVLVSAVCCTLFLSGCAEDKAIVPVPSVAIAPVEETVVAPPAETAPVETWHGRPYLCSNAARPTPRRDSAVPTVATIPRTHATETIRQELAAAIEAAAVRRDVSGGGGLFDSGYIGAWTLIELTPRIVSLAVELRASEGGIPPERYQLLLRDAHRRLVSDGMRIFYVRVTGGVSIPAYVLLENQHGESGRLVEATPALRTRGVRGGTDYGIFELEDPVEDDDATFTVAFRGSAWDHHRRSYVPTNAFLQFTFDATQAQAMLAISGTFPPHAREMETDSNGDGFTIADALDTLGSVSSIVQAVTAIAVVL